MELRARAVVPQHCEQGAAGGPQHHPGNAPARVTVLAEDVADAGAVACAEVGQGAYGRPMRNHDRRVVLDLRARVDSANEVVDLLA